MREDGRDEWSTPEREYAKICHHWNVRPTLDVCASIENTKCPSFISAETDALTVSWDAHACWMNPPYSQPLMTKFIEKAIHEAKFGAVTLFLLPAWVDQNWYHDLIKPYPHEFWRGRIKHLPPPGVKPSSPRHGSIHGVIRQSGLVWSDLI